MDRAKKFFKEILYFLTTLMVDLGFLKVFILYGTVVAFSGCNKSPTKISRNSRLLNPPVMQDLQFFRDKRSELCFAIYSKYNAGYLAHIPCTPAVEKLLEKERE